MKRWIVEYIHKKYPTFFKTNCFNHLQWFGIYDIVNGVIIYEALMEINIKIPKHYNKVYVKKNVWNNKYSFVGYLMESEEDIEPWCSITNRNYTRLNEFIFELPQPKFEWKVIEKREGVYKLIDTP